MKLKHILRATVSSVALLGASGAIAGSNNDAVLDQDGNNNTAAITQNLGSGEQTNLRQVGNGNVAARTSGTNPMKQYGDNNVLDVDQSGEENRIGTQATGVKQSGDRSTATLEQTDRFNTIGQVSQTGAL